MEELTFRLTFDAREAAGVQRFMLNRLVAGEATDPQASGEIIAQGQTGETATGPAGLRLWAGKAGDPFWIEPDVLHAVGHAFQDGTTVDLTGWDRSKARNLFAGHTVYSIVVEVPDTEFAAAPGGRIGVWAVASLATDAGGWHAVNRVGLPMIHPLFTQYDEDLGNRLNAGIPADDFATHGARGSKAIAGVVAAYGTSVDPAGYGEAVAHRFFPNILPYVVGTSATFGFGGWNGRSLTDNAPDVMFSLAANTPITLGIGRESVTPKPIDHFPYMPPAA